MNDFIAHALDTDGSARFITKLNAALEFLPYGSVIPYDIVEKGILLEDNPNSAWIDVKDRLKTMDCFGMRYDAGRECFITDMDPRGLLDDGVECVVDWLTVANEPNSIWWERIGEIQLHRLMAEIPYGYQFKFYPEVSA